MGGTCVAIFAFQLEHQEKGLRVVYPIQVPNNSFIFFNRLILNFMNHAHALCLSWGLKNVLARNCFTGGKPRQVNETNAIFFF